MTVDLSDYINRALEFSTRGPLQQEVRRAREQYFQQSGQLHDDEPSYELRIEAFSEWYLLDYLRAENRRPPLDTFLAEQRSQLSAEDIAIYEAMRSSRRSLFEFLKHKKDLLLLRDLQDNKKLLLVEETPLLGIERGQLLDGRLVRFKGMLVIRGSVVIHPASVRRNILKRIKKLHKQRPQDFDAFRRALSLARLRCDRYHNVAAERLYVQTLGEAGFAD